MKRSTMYQVRVQGMGQDVWDLESEWAVCRTAQHEAQVVANHTGEPVRVVRVETVQTELLIETKEPQGTKND